MTDTSAAVAACLSHPLHRSNPKSGCSGGLTNSQATTTVTACYWTAENSRGLGKSQDAIGETKAVHRPRRANSTRLATSTGLASRMTLWLHRSWSLNCAYCLRYQAIVAMFADEIMDEKDASEAFLWLWCEQDYLGPHHLLQATTAITTVVSWLQQSFPNSTTSWVEAC